MPDPTRRYTTYFVSYHLDLEQMRKAAGYLVGEHDFASFCNIHTDVEDTVRTIYELTVEKSGEDLTIRVRGNGFLYNMVRIIAGTLLQVGRGFYTPEDVRGILDTKDRESAGVTAPPHGLMLMRIEYEKDLDKSEGDGVV